MRGYRSLGSVVVAIAAISPTAEADPAPCLDRASSRRDEAVSEAKVAMCFEAPASCWTFDLATKTWAASKLDAAERLPGAVSRPDEARPLPAQLTANIKTCDKDGKDCRTIDVPGAAAAGAEAVVATADRSLVAVYGSRGPLSLFDGKTEKLLAQIQPWKTEMGRAIHSAQFLGQTLLVLENDSPITSAGRLYDRTGKKLGDAGPGDSLTGEPVAVAPDEWAFTALETGRVYIDNVKTGKHLAKIDSVLGKKQVAGVSILHRTADARMLVIVSGDLASGVVLHDIATRTSKRFAPPVCR